MTNLDIFLASLRSGRRPKPFVYGFLHVEPSDVIAIDQTGGGKLAATRLYVYPDTATETLYLLTIGDKDSQSDDILDCKAFVKQIREIEGEEADGPEEDRGAGGDQPGDEVGGQADEGGG